MINTTIQNAILKVASTTIPVIEKLKFDSEPYNVYLSGLSQGIWASICDTEIIKQNDIYIILDKTIRELYKNEEFKEKLKKLA